MSKGKSYSVRFIVILLAVLIAYFGLVKLSILPISILHASVICISLFIVFVLGLLIVAPGFSQGPEKFVVRVIVLTSFQLLAAMFILLAFVVSKQTDVRSLCFHFIGLFAVVLTFQSVFLVQINNKNTI